MSLPPRALELTTPFSCDDYCMHGSTCVLMDSLESLDDVLNKIDIEELWGDLSKLYTCVCPANYYGARCQNMFLDFANKPEERSNTEMVAGIAVAMLLLVVFGVIGVVVWRRRRFVNREKARNNQMKKRQQNRTTIEGYSVVDGSPPKVRCVASISSEESKKTTNPSYTPEIKSRLPYGPIKFRVEAPHMQRNNSAMSVLEMKRTTTHNKTDFIEDAEKNNNGNKVNNEKSKMAAASPQISSLKIECDV